MFENFDKTKTYIGLQFGTSLIAKKIAKYSKIYCPGVDKVPTHIIALAYVYGEWTIYESTHTARLEYGLNSGVRHYKQEKFLKLENINEYKFYQLDVSVPVLDELLGEQYAMATIKDLMLAAIHKNNGKQKDRQGYICSEYIAKAFYPILEYFMLPSYCITPAHFYKYILDNGIQECKI